MEFDVIVHNKFQSYKKKGCEGLKKGSLIQKKIVMCVTK